MTSKNKKNSGFTLIEILFGIAIFVLIALALSLFSRNVWVYNSVVSAGLTNADAARQILKNIVAEVRTASSAETGAYVIGGATDSSFIFYSDIDDDGITERIRYFVSGNSFQKGVIEPTGSPLTYNAANETITTFVGNITNSSVFSYYDENYDGTTAALASPVTISAIRLVKISLTIEKDPNRSPVPVTFSTQVSIRNLKDNL